MNILSRFRSNGRIPVDLNPPPPPPIATPIINLVFGIPKEVKQIRGISSGTSKLILETGKTALVQIMGGKQDSFFTVEDRGEFWVIYQEVKREVVL